MHRARKHACSQTAALRAGTILVIVLVVVALLALGAYTFAEIMTVEAQATSAFGREVQARALADSGVEQAASLLQKRYLPESQNYYSVPQMFEGVLVQNSASAKGKGRFSVVAGNELDMSGRSVRFGISDESSKLNLNTMMNLVVASTIQPADAETMLMAFPDMTVEIADAILDWMDTDVNPMQNGVEDDYYQGLAPPYKAKNGPLDSLDELLLVKGVTPQLLFGEDTNHNGILDPNENDGAASLPFDNADGTLQRGWSGFWTVYSREVNLRSDGTPRINVNQTDLTNLFNQISGDFDENTAQFVLAYRLNGPSGGSGGSGGSSGGSSGSSSGSSGSSSSGSPGSNSGSSKSSGGSSGSSGGSGGSSGSKSGSSSGGSSSSGSSSGGSGGSSGSSGSSGGGSSSGSSGSSSSGGSSSGSGSSGGSSSSSGSQGSGKSAAPANPILVGGIDISKGASYTIKSLYELPGAATAALSISGTSKAPTNPWQSSPPAALTQCLPLIMDKLTLTDNPYIDGRININTAPREVLMGLAGLSGMSEAIVDSIYGAQPHNTGSSGSDVPADRLITGWLVIDNLVNSINTLETIDPLITGRGDVFHVQSVGYFEGGGPMARVEAVIDATQDPPQVIFMRDLTELGRGFSASLLSTGR